MKRIITAVVTTAMVAAISLSAFATSAFNTAVFDEGQDIVVQTDSMTGETIVFTKSLVGAKGTISTGRKERVEIYGAVTISDAFDLHSIVMNYYADNWAFINEVIVKIGDTRYHFTDFDIIRDVRSDATIEESAFIPVKSLTIPFMQDLIENRDKEVRVRLCGKNKDAEFVMTDDMKNSLINLYNLFVAGGGTQAANMDVLDVGDETQVRVVKAKS